MAAEGVCVSLATRIASAFSRAPTAAVTFEKRDGTTTTGVAIGEPAEPSPADSFRDQQMTRSKARKLTVSPEGLSFVPQPEMYALWEGVRWNVIGVVPYAPAGVTLLYEVTVQR
jgi:hypothetical protein